VTPGQAPYLTVVRGEPTDAELAAVVAVLAARAATGAASRRVAQARSDWASRQRLMRQPVHAGTGAWRASATRW
jgi:hypothetical protein